MDKGQWDKLLSNEPINKLAAKVTNSETETDESPYTFYPLKQFKTIAAKLKKQYNIRLTHAYNVLAQELGFLDYQEYLHLLEVKETGECPKLMLFRTKKQRPRKRDLIK